VTPRTRRKANAGQRCRSAGDKSRWTRVGQSNAPASGFDARGGEIARDAGDAGSVGTIRGHGDVDDRVVEPGKAGVGDADRRVLRKLDDPLVIVAERELRRRAQHAVRFDAADDALGEGHLLAGNIRADRRENALHARSRIGRAADDLHRAGAGFDDADFEPVGVGMRLGLDDGSNHEAVILAARVVDALHFETDAGQRVDDLGERSRRVEVVEKPGEGEFHWVGFSFSFLRQGASRVSAERLRRADQEFQ
jgi:hypothetical protein